MLELNRNRNQLNSATPEQERTRPLRVMLLQSSLAHYRRGLIRELGSIPDLDLRIVADSTSETPFVETMSLPDHLFKTFVEAPVRHFKGPKGIQLLWQPRAVSAFFQIKPDVVVALGSPYLLTTWALALLGRAFRVPVVLWTHGLLSLESGPKWWLRSMQFRLATGLALYGERAERLLIRKGIRSSKLRVIYNSLNVDEQSQEYFASKTLNLADVKRDLGIEDADRVLIFTGRLQAPKGIDRLVSAIASLRNQGRNVHLLLVGEGELARSLRSQATCLGIEDRVHFLGAIHAERDLARCYRASDLSVIPSRPGLTVMHSLIYGVPVLTTDKFEEQFPEAEAIIPGETGFFCDTSDGAALSVHLERVLFPMSPRARMEERCRDVIMSKFTPQRQALSLYLAAVTASDSARNTGVGLQA